MAIAREAVVIYNALTSKLVKIASNVGITVIPSLWAETDYKKLILYCVADSQSIQEQLYDSFLEDAEEISERASAQNEKWFQDKFLNLFEYNATTVPIIQFDEEEFFPYYPNPNAN